MADLKDMAEHIQDIETLKDLPKGTFVMIQMKDDLDPEIQMELSEAVLTALADAPVRVLLVPGGYVEQLKVMSLADIMELREALDMIVAERASDVVGEA